MPFVYFPIIVAADALRTRLAGAPRAGAWLKLASALMLTAVVAVLLVQIRL